MQTKQQRRKEHVFCTIETATGNASNDGISSRSSSENILTLPFGASLPCPIVNVSGPGTECICSMRHSMEKRTSGHGWGNPEPEQQTCDSSGYALFSDGEAGAMHVIAHRMLDSNQVELGHRLLGQWLNGREGSGSEWVHLQWHMAIFELTLGHWPSALERFHQHILPAVLTSEDALTDAPALLWRLYLAAGNRFSLPWEPVRIRALSAIQRPHTTFVTMHNLLALAGAGDLDNLDQWIERQSKTVASRVENLVLLVGTALRSFVARRFEDAAVQLAMVKPNVASVGGSRAQNELFSKLHDLAFRNAARATSGYAFAQAA
jgi:hypothetical protein